MEKLTELMVVVVCCIVCLIVTIRQFKEKGFLFNNAYIYASEDEREKMNKKPYYRQTGMVFAILTLSFILLGLYIIFEKRYWLYINFILYGVVVVYAIVSSVLIEKRQKRDGKDIDNKEY